MPIIVWFCHLLQFNRKHILGTGIGRFTTAVSLRAL